MSFDDLCGVVGLQQLDGIVFARFEEKLRRSLVGPIFDDMAVDFACDAREHEHGFAGLVCEWVFFDHDGTSKRIILRDKRKYLLFAEWCSLLLNQFLTGAEKMFKNIRVLKNHLGQGMRNQLMVDTNILSNIAKNEPRACMLDKLLIERNVTLFYCLASLMELGFGPDGKVHPQELKLSEVLYQKALKECYDPTRIASVLLKSPDISFGGKWIAISPDVNSWIGGKIALTNYMTTDNKEAKNASTYRIDTLISVSAWNSLSYVWTEDIDDFLLIDYYVSLGLSTRKPVSDVKEYIARTIRPIFNTEILLEVVNGDKKIDIYERMSNFVRHEKIKEILKIASKILAEETGNS